MLFGLLISIMPHLVQWVHSGSPVWIADNEEQLYLSYASQAYFNHPARLTPVFAPNWAIFYPWIQLISAVLFATLLKLGPFAISMIWRAFAGISIAGAWYLVVKSYARSRWRPNFWSTDCASGDITQSVDGRQDKRTLGQKSSDTSGVANYYSWVEPRVFGLLFTRGERKVWWYRLRCAFDLRQSKAHCATARLVRCRMPALRVKLKRGFHG